MKEVAPPTASNESLNNFKWRLLESNLDLLLLEDSSQPDKAEVLSLRQEALSILVEAAATHDVSVLTEMAKLMKAPLEGMSTLDKSVFLNDLSSDSLVSEEDPVLNGCTPLTAVFAAQVGGESGPFKSILALVTEQREGEIPTQILDNFYGTLRILLLDLNADPRVVDGRGRRPLQLCASHRKSYRDFCVSAREPEGRLKLNESSTSLPKLSDITAARIRGELGRPDVVLDEVLSNACAILEFGVERRTEIMNLRDDVLSAALRYGLSTSEPEEPAGWDSKEHRAQRCFALLRKYKFGLGSFAEPQAQGFLSTYNAEASAGNDAALAGLAIDKETHDQIEKLFKSHPQNATGISKQIPGTGDSEYYSYSNRLTKVEHDILSATNWQMVTFACERRKWASEVEAEAATGAYRESVDINKLSEAKLGDYQRCLKGLA